MKLYAFVNMYMSGVHAGIQTAHLVSSMHNKYSDALFEGVAADTFHRWAEKDRTIIALHAGDHRGLCQLFDRIEQICLPRELPYGRWHESEDALMGACTAVGVVIPSTCRELNAIAYRYRLAI